MGPFARVVAAGVPHHVTQRGNGKRHILAGDDFGPAEVLQYSAFTPGNEYGVDSEGYAYFGFDELAGWDWVGSAYDSVYVPNPSPPSSPQPPLDPCAVSSNPQSGYTSIVSTGTTGSGNFSVSFSGTNFSSLTPSVTYGPYSTPSSIAASMAAFITRNYLQYGLSAKAFGPNIVYSGLTTIGAVTSAVTGSYISTSTSSASASATESACESAPPAPPPGLSCSSVTRGASTTCVANGGAVSNWSFTDGTNTVTRTTNTTSPTWSGVMVTSGTVYVTIGEKQMSATITVSPRTGWAFTAVPATQQTNPYTAPMGSPCLSLSVDITPVAPPVGSFENLGLSDPCQNSAYTAQAFNSGPNSGYSFFTSASNRTEYDWVGSNDVLNSSSVFYGKQCGNYSAATGVGFISGANLSLNTIRHESSAKPGQGHYGNYVAAQNLPSLNVGTAYEAITAYDKNPVPGNYDTLKANANNVIPSKQDQINVAAGVEPPEPQYNGLGVFLGNINYPPYALPTDIPTCP